MGIHFNDFRCSGDKSNSKVSQLSDANDGKFGILLGAKRRLTLVSDDGRSGKVCNLLSLASRESSLRFGGNIGRLCRSLRCRLKDNLLRALGNCEIVFTLLSLGELTEAEAETLIGWAALAITPSPTPIAGAPGSGPDATLTNCKWRAV